MNQKTQVIIPPLDPQENESVRAFLDEANDFVIDSEAVRALADADLARMKRQRTQLEEMRKTLKAPILEAGSTVDNMFKPMIDLVDQAVSILSRKIISFDAELAAARAEEQRKAEEAAKAQRLALEAQAKRLAETGNTEAAAAIQEAAVLVTAPAIQMSVPSSSRSTTPRTTWTAEVVDMKALLKSVLDGNTPMEAVEANTAYLNGRARLEHEKLAIPGVRAVGEKSLASRRAA